ncbi:hypothetical protein LSAT2_025273, partial [Lamellibrachia satsuma]
KSGVLERGVGNEQAVRFEKFGGCYAVDVPSVTRVFPDKILVIFPVSELNVEISSDVEQCARRGPGRASSEQLSLCSALLMLTRCVVVPYTLMIVNRQL